MLMGRRYKFLPNKRYIIITLVARRPFVVVYANGSEDMSVEHTKTYLLTNEL